MYLRPGTLDEAVAALSAPGGRILAGGTDIFPAAGDRPLAGPIIDISRLAELDGIVLGDDRIRIGARTSWSSIIATPLPRCFDALKAAAREVGSIQIQNLGTIAGNLCNASPAADGVPPLLALDAAVELRSCAGTRTLPLSDFIAGNRRTARRDDEIVTAVTVPRTIDAGASTFLKLGARRYLVISIAMVAAVVEAGADGRVAQARIAVGSCSAVAQRLSALEQALVGAPVQPGLGALARPEHLAPLSPIDDVRASAAYRLDAALTLVRRALDTCALGAAAEI
ncbi:xanthine dehydrogenase family protein subunit M [Mycobacterium sp. KBS0706]|uniref:FAD binding domain-containing protein n=1 Tax=Mycobacterium sp. KBS0706 TaxID=2578109 RepID=UPI00110FD964|nr:xanthine dehydrogenase family protein subunit M [Mycobacterium sp. KBS0706]TSD85933.1 xanthine dehydrogenase family protein subunit M [Mycobacterium sp. KBS0706]